MGVTVALGVGAGVITGVVGPVGDGLGAGAPESRIAQVTAAPTAITRNAARAMMSARRPMAQRVASGGSPAAPIRAS